MTSEKIQKNSGDFHYEPHLALTQVSWKPLLDEPLRIRAQNIACSVAERMRDPDIVHGAAEQVRQQERHPTSWFSLPGIAMALLAASTPVTPTWDRILVIA